MTNDIREQVRGFILRTQLPGESPENLRDTTPLITSGILDSLAVLSLAEFLTQTFGVELDVYDTSVEHFDTIDRIARTVGRRQVQPMQQTA
jgi:acyl carrier protein